MAAKRRKLVEQDFDRGYGATTIPTDSGGSRSATKVGAHTWRKEYSVLDFCGEPNGVTDNSTLFQDAIDAAVADGGGDVIVPGHGRIYRVGNIQLKSGVNIIGVGWPTLKLPDNAVTTSYNGATADGNGFYAANVLGTTLSYLGAGTGSRATSETNSSYIVENVLIRGLILDGNKSNNVCDNAGGANRSVEGECISLHNSSRIAIEECVLQNARLDAVMFGYSEDGGTDYSSIRDCYITGSGRCGLAIITGKYNQVKGNTIRHSGTGPGIDVEANIAGEVNYRHQIVNNPLIEGGVSVETGSATALQTGLLIRGNLITGYVSWRAAGSNAGTIIDNNDIIAATAGSFGSNKLFEAGAPLYITGTSAVTAVSEPIQFINNRCSGHVAATAHQYSANQHAHSIIRGNTFNVKYGFNLSRPWKITIENNTLNVTGASAWVANTAYVVGQAVRPNTDTGHYFICTTAGTSHATTEPTWTTSAGGTNTDGTVTWTEAGEAAVFDVFFAQISTYTNQGQVRVIGNIIRGSNVSRLITEYEGSDPTTLTADHLVFRRNDFNCTTLHATDSAALVKSATLEGNEFRNLTKRMLFSGAFSNARIKGNLFHSVANPQISAHLSNNTFTKAEIRDNTYDGCLLELLNIQYCIVRNNSIIDSYLYCAYTGTAAGGSAFIGNVAEASGSAITNAFVLATGGSYAATDFNTAGNDVFTGNVAVGEYTTPVSIADYPVTLTDNYGTGGVRT